MFFFYFFSKSTISEDKYKCLKKCGIIFYVNFWINNLIIKINILKYNKINVYQFLFNKHKYFKFKFYLNTCYFYI